MHDKIHFELAHFEDSTDTNIILLMDLMRKVGRTRDTLVNINSITDEEIEDNIDDEDDSVNKDYVGSLDKQHLMMYDLINNILWVVWDPLGISQIDGSCNAFEYYCKDLLELKINNASICDIADFLYDAEAKIEGIQADYTHCEKVAAIIHAI
jgi:hypothetical protein